MQRKSSQFPHFPFGVFSVGSDDRGDLGIKRIRYLLVKDAYLVGLEDIGTDLEGVEVHQGIRHG